MAEELKHLYRYRVLRYTPDIERDEWVNIGILLEQASESEREGIFRRAFRVVEEPSELARVKRLHPGADESLLRALPTEFDARLRSAPQEAARYIEKLGDTLSNVLQFSPQKALLADDFDLEMDRLYRAHVAPPARQRAGIVESTRAWIKERINDAFRRRRVPKLERNIPVEAVYRARRPAETRLRLSKRDTRIPARGCSRARSFAAEDTGLHSQARACAHPRHGIYGHLRNRAIAGQPAAPVHCANVRGREHRHCFLGAHRQIRRRPSPAFAVGNQRRPQASGSCRRPRRISAAHAPR